MPSEARVSACSELIAAPGEHVHEDRNRRERADDRDQRAVSTPEGAKAGDQILEPGHPECQ
jgi:hypothetical protein